MCRIDQMPGDGGHSPRHDLGRNHAYLAVSIYKIVADQKLVRLAMDHSPGRRTADTLRMNGQVEFVVDRVELVFAAMRHVRRVVDHPQLPRPGHHSTDAAFVVLGSGNPDLERDLKLRKMQYPDRIVFRGGHDEGLAHLIIAGSDFLLIPSRYEPCGLTQLYALRYGTIPIVRKTGGLADTIEHFDAASGKGNGCVFNDPDVGALVWALSTALQWYRDPRTWQILRTNAMTADHSWSQRVDSYVNLYSRVLQLAG